MVVLSTDVMTQVVLPTLTVLPEVNPLPVMVSTALDALAKLTGFGETEAILGVASVE